MIHGNTVAKPVFTQITFRSEYGHFIDGKWVGGSSGETIEQFNPATGAPLARIQSGNPEDINRAVAAAERAFPMWSNSSTNERQLLLMEISRRLRERASEYGLMESLNNGKTFKEAMNLDVPFAADIFAFFAGAGHFALHGELQDYRNMINLVHREPIGVCAQIIPWNIPLLCAAQKLSTALATGNTVVLKPAETVCLTVLEFIDEMSDIIPPGVVNVVTGYGPKVGEALVTHPSVRKVAFTGSVATGRKIVEYASRNLISQTLELGGKSAHIICPSGDVDAAVESAALSTVFNKGEVCVAGTRLFVHESLKDEVSEKLARLLGSLRVGDPQNDATQMGAQASKVQLKRVLGYLDLAREEGAKVLCGGGLAKVSGFENGNFVQPTLLTNVNNRMRIAREEIFGPVTCVIGWSNEQELMQQVNDNDYGLASGLWTKDLTQAHRISRQIQAGIVWINRYFNFRAGMPAGGYKLSGIGVENSREAMEAYTIRKSVAINMDEGKIGYFG